jgi:hypothetical protein
MTPTSRKRLSGDEVEKILNETLSDIQNGLFMMMILLQLEIYLFKKQLQ